MKIQAITGMKDLLPEETPLWEKVEGILRETVESYGYSEIRMPILEKTDLFVRSIGEVTDVVEKEMYSFEDVGGDKLSLRPEGTAGCVRACNEHGIIHNQERRLWYMGPMFRHEKPQKGRYREFHQFGIEVFGLTGPDIDAEILMLTNRIWQKFGISDHVKLELNSPDPLRRESSTAAGSSPSLRSIRTCLTRTRREGCTPTLCASLTPRMRQCRSS